jgi:hypothetical protein
MNMTTITRRLLTVAAALALVAAVAADANACCGASYSAGYAPYTAGYMPYTSYYSPAYSSYYAPSYTTNYAGGWYPGYWADRIRTRLWGSPATYVAAYPATYGTYATSYAPACSSCTAGYAASYAPACSSCSPCSSCCTASYAPSCDTCSSYSGGSSYGGAMQAGYGQSSCPNCSAQSTGMMQQQPQPNTVIAPPGTTVIQQNGVPAATEPAPSLGQGQGQPQSTYSQRPADGTNSVLQPQPQQQQQQQPQQPSSTHPEYDVKKDSSTYLEAPKLFNPNDRTAQRSIAPVHTAVYNKPAGSRPISTAPARITAEQAQRDAAGWTSAN